MSTEPIRSFPCIWPESYPRTKLGDRIRSSFKQTPDTVQRALREELRKLGATDPIISTNAPVKKDGSLYYDAMKRKVAQDPSVAVYFDYDGGQKVLCCDQYETIWENMYAITKAIDALRGIDRWGVSDFIKKAFTGFQALPPSTSKKQWWKVLGGYQSIPPITDVHYNIVKGAYRDLSKKYHPDGTDPDPDKMTELNISWEKAQQYFKGIG